MKKVSQETSHLFPVVLRIDHFMVVNTLEKIEVK